MSLVEIGMIVCWALCAAGLAAYAASVAREITYVTLADGRKAERRLPLVVRLLLPLVPNLRRFASGRPFAAARAQADQMIVSGGLEGLLSGTEFVALKFLVPISCGTAWVAFVLLLGALMPKLQRNRLAGARFSWTLVNREVWQKSNRIGGLYTMLLGAFMIVSGVLAPERKALFTSADIWAIILYIIVLTMHSRLIAVKIDPPKKQDGF